MKHLILDIIEIILIGLAVTVMVWLFLVSSLEVAGDSMEPTLLNKEHIAAYKVVGFNSKFKRGDIVVFTNPNTGQLLVKRIIGLPNEEIMILDNEVYINGYREKEPYLPQNTQTNPSSLIKEGEPLLIPAESYFLMGDNRAESTDSRSFGPIEKDAISGKVFLIYQPTENIRIIK